MNAQYAFCLVVYYYDKLNLRFSIKVLFTGEGPKFIFLFFAYCVVMCYVVINKIMAHWSLVLEIERVEIRC